MALPLPLLDAQNAAGRLGTLWNGLQRGGTVPPGRAPVLLLSLPPAWGNRYQALLYGQAAVHGVAVAGVRHPADLDHISWPGQVVLHAHWFASVFTSALSEADANARLDRMMQRLEDFRTRTGAHLLWSAHNVFPHGNRFPDTYLALRRWIFERFDTVHVMDDSHVPLLEARFDRRAPDSFCVPHMTYHGAVPDSTGSHAARAHFGLPEEAFVFGAFGSLQGYKNLDLLLESFTALADAHPRRQIAALLGGLPTDARLAQGLAMRFGGDARITLLLRRIEDAEIQYLHRASDVMVLPYRDTLNSGAALMAATFARPFVMPQVPGAEGMVPLGARLYDPADPAALHGALAACLADRDSGTLAGPDPAAIAARQPQRISDAFFEALTARLNRQAG